MNFRDQDQSNIFLQDYRCVVTVIRQEDVGVDVYDKCYSLPCVCVCGSSCHMPRKEEGSAQGRTKPQTPAPKGATSSADERAKADKEAQRVERGQAKLKALQFATDSAKAPMRSQDTASDTSTRPKTAKLTDKTASSTQASSSGTGDTPIPKEKAAIRKRPAQSEDESGALPPTPAESETSQPAATTDPQQANQPIEESQSSQVDPQQSNKPIEETQSSQPEEPIIQGSSSVKKRMTKKGSAGIAEQGSIGELRGGGPPASSIEDTKAKSPSKAVATPKETAVRGGTLWSEFPDDPPESFNTAIPDTVPMAKPKPIPVPGSLNPSAAAVAVPRPGSSVVGKFLLQADETNDWPKREPKVQLPMWKKKDAFLTQFLNKKVVIAHCPAGSGKSTILPALAAMHVHPKVGRVCCTQIRRVTTQFVCRDTKDVWGIARDSQVIGFRHSLKTGMKSKPRY